LIGLIASALFVSWAIVRHQRVDREHHHQFLRGLLVTAPTEDQVRTAVGVEPFRVAKPDDAPWLARVWTNPMNSPADVEAKMKKWPKTVVFLKSPMVYFVYFDAQGLMRDYSCLSN
jgi:hypothetical protein